MKIEWTRGKGLPSLLKGGAMGMVDGVPVYAAGMTFPWRETEQAWSWDEARDDWFPVEPSLPVGRAYANGATLGDGLLVLGGRKRTDGLPLSLPEAWWLRRRRGEFHWTRLPDMGYRRAVPVIGTSGSRVLALGGGEWERSQGGAFTTRHLTNYEVLDVDDLGAGWKDMGPVPFEPLEGSAYASIGASAYVFGGVECWTEDDTRHIRFYCIAWRYDFPTDEWTRLADLPVSGSGWCAIAFGDEVVIIGGNFTMGHPGEGALYRTDRSDEYRTELALNVGTWRERTIGAYSDLAFVYDTRSDNYTVLEERLPAGLNDLRCAISGKTIFAAGGETIDPALSNTTDVFMIGRIVD